MYIYIYIDISCSFSLCLLFGFIPNSPSLSHCASKEPRESWWYTLRLCIWVLLPWSSFLPSFLPSFLRFSSLYFPLPLPSSLRRPFHPPASFFRFICLWKASKLSVAEQRRAAPMLVTHRGGEISWNTRDGVTRVSSRWREGGYRGFATRVEK